MCLYHTCVHFCIMACLGPRVAFAAAPKQIKGLVYLLIALLWPFLGLDFEWWP